MKKPRKIKIGGTTFKIVYRTMESWGECDLDSLTISISKECLKDEAVFQQTLAHECCHAALRLSGCDYSCLDGDSNKEEGVVRCFENMLIPVIRAIYKQAP